jgi:hypothetical protein
VPLDLRLVAGTFIALQVARHRADYDVSIRFTRQQTPELVQAAELAFSAWANVRKTIQADALLVAMPARTGMAR